VISYDFVPFGFLSVSNITPPPTPLNALGINENLMSILKQSRRFCLVVLIIGLVCVVNVLHASDGDIDTAFGTSGGLYFDYGSFFAGYPGDQPAGLVVQPDGSVITVSDIFESVSGGAVYRIGLTRFLSDGSVDLSFGEGVAPGRVILTPDATDTNQSWYAARIALSADGNIYLAGHVGPDFYDTHSQAAAWRLTSAGQLDTGFGTNGITLIDRGMTTSSDAATALVVGSGYDEPLDSLVVAGSVSDDGGNTSQAALFFLDAGGNSLVTANPNIGNATLPNGASWWRGSSSCPTLADGKAQTTIASLDFNKLYFNGVGSTHYLIATGTCRESIDTFPQRVVVMAFDATSNLDATFGDAGISYLGFGSSLAAEPSYATAAELEYDDEGNDYVTIEGYVQESDNQTHIGLAQLQGNGQFNPYFGNFGHLTIDLGACCGNVVDHSYSVDLLVQRDGKLIVGGTKVTDYGNPATMILLRRNQYGGADASFGSVGAVLGAREYTVPGSSGPENEAAAIAFTAGEKLLFLGATGDGYGNYPTYTGLLQVQNDRVFTDDFEGGQLPP
jgi:uncharacterized delta-60 repeat protein